MSAVLKPFIDKNTHIPYRIGDVYPNEDKERVSFLAKAGYIAPSKVETTVVEPEVEPVVEPEVEPEAEPEVEPGKTGKGKGRTKAGGKNDGAGIGQAPAH